MKLVCDSTKRLANLAKHRMDLASVDAGFLATARIVEAKPSRFGAKRYKAIGRLEGRVVVVVFSRLGSEALAVISLRPASLKERREL